MEGAVIVPVLLIFVLGVYEFSWFFYQQHLVSTGLRDAARYLARMSTTCASATPGWAIAAANAGRLATTGSLAGGIPRVKGWTSATMRIDCRGTINATGPAGTSTYRGGSEIYVVTVSTRFADPSLGFLGLLGLSAPIVSLAHSERMIGPG